MSAALSTTEPSNERSLRSTTRNPRRRPRQSDSDSMRTAPRRKRSKLNDDTFVPRTDTETNGGAVVIPSTEGRRGTTRVRKDSIPSIGYETELTVRGGKKTSLKRAHRVEVGTTLVQNALYTAKSLPSTPRELKKDGVAYRGSICAASNRALATTHHQAFIWDYAAHTATAVPRVFDVPFTTRNSDPVPFGALVVGGSGEDTGLVLLSAANGKVVYYDSIERAASLSLFQSRTVAATEGTIGSLFSSETVVDLASAESAGFIVLLSSGRMAQLTLRDQAGKPRVQAQFLRSQDPGSGGIFGSIKGFIGVGAWKRDTCAIRTRPLGQRGQMQVVSATARGESQIWNLDWSGQYEYKASLDFRELLFGQLRTIYPSELQSKAEHFAVQDFAIINESKPASGNELATIGTDKPLSIMLLLAVGDRPNEDYVVVEIAIEAASARAERVLPLKTYRPTQERNSSTRPRLVVPKPGHTAFVMFEDALVLVSMTDNAEDGPEAQLNQPDGALDTFEDALYLRQDRQMMFLDINEEECKTGNSSCIAFVEGAGLVRLQAHDPVGDVERTTLPVKSKLEAAVFYGAMHENIFDLSKQSDPRHTLAEVEHAALQISSEILKSETNLLTSNMQNIEANLIYRAQSLQALVKAVRTSFPPLNHVIMWQLMWDAERIAAGEQMWKSYNQHLEQNNQHGMATVMDELSKWMYPGEDGNEEDLVRRVFLKNLDRLDRLLPFAKTLIKDQQTTKGVPPEKLLALVSEADDMWLTCMETVYSFRAENASNYGISPPTISEGVLADVANYVDLPEPWTATGNMVRSATEMVERSRSAAKDFFESDQSQDDGTIDAHCQKIATENYRLVQICCLAWQEHIRWLASRPSSSDQDKAEKLEIGFEQTRYKQCRALAEIGQAEAGMRLAEKFHDMLTLNEMVMGETQYFIEALNEPESEEQRTVITQALDDINKRVGRYFEQFGEDWSNAFFSEGLGGSKAGILLNESQMFWPEPLTKWLRTEKDRAKICWINEVQQEQGYQHASKALETVATEQETSLWAKKVELSLSKLALLAAREQTHAAERPSPADNAQEDAVDHGLVLVDAQEKLYELIKPEILGAIDEQAELQFAMEKFGHRLGGSPALNQLFENCMAKVIRHQACSVEELIDILSLIELKDLRGFDDDYAGKEYYLALQVLDAVAPQLKQERFTTLLQLIWKRCYLCDNWNDIASATKKTEDEITDILRKTALWRTLHACIFDSLFDQPDSDVRFLKPSDCVGAACAPQDLRYRFPSDEILQPILNDIRVQDETLQKLINDRQLDNWVDTCKYDAKKRVEEEAEERAADQERERDFEASFVDEPSEVVDGVSGNGNGHVIAPNGIRNFGLDDEIKAESEDIEMG